MGTIDHNDKCPECGQRKNYHPATGEYCLFCGWVEYLHTPGPWTVTRDPGSEIGGRLLEQAITEQRLFEWEQYHPNLPFMEALFELHNANNDRLIEAVPELFALYLEVKRILQVDDAYWNLIPEPAKADLRRALFQVEQTRLRHLDQNVKKFMEGES